jgi:hypothetical protein
MGAGDGARLNGMRVGLEGPLVGCCVGCRDGWDMGWRDGRDVGWREGCADGRDVGW